MTESYHVKAARHHIEELNTYDELANTMESKSAKEILTKKAEIHRKLYELHAKQAIISRSNKNK